MATDPTRSAATTSGISPGWCGIHGYHGRTACPTCSTSASPAPLLSSPVPVSLASRDRMLTELQENGRLTFPQGWPLWYLLDLIETLGIDVRDVHLHGENVVVMRRGT